MFDSVLIANVVVCELKIRKKSGLLMKVDYEKTYNSVR